VSFNEGVRIDPGRASGGGHGAGLAIGGGAGGLLLLVVALVLGVDPSGLVGGGSGAVPQGGGEEFAHCRSGADANAHVDCRIIATAESLDVVWAERLPAETGVEYVPAGLRIFTGSTTTGCGPATSAVGPFYCPRDATTYFDPSFFELLRERFGAAGGPLAEEYVVAHEFGHHVENQLGLLDAAQRDPQGAQSGAVRVELMADCLAGVWAHHAVQAVDPESGETFLAPLSDADIADALSAAAAVGDDSIQQQTSGQVDPEAFTHGTSEQRQRWFTTGYESGLLADCDTRSAAL
jgi:uncharacterized protein